MDAKLTSINIKTTNMQHEDQTICVSFDKSNHIGESDCLGIHENTNHIFINTEDFEKVLSAINIILEENNKK